MVVAWLCPHNLKDKEVRGCVCGIIIGNYSLLRGPHRTCFLMNGIIKNVDSVYIARFHTQNVGLYLYTVVAISKQHCLMLTC